MEEDRVIPRSVLESLCEEIRKNTVIAAPHEHFDVKRGLRNADGSGVIAGLTTICNVHGYVMNEGEKAPVEGRLTYRGVDVTRLVEGCAAEQRFGYEETVYLLLFGTLPTKKQLSEFSTLMSEFRDLPPYFAEDMIIKAPSPNILNKMSRAVLAMYSYDPDADDTSPENVLGQCLRLIAQMPTIMAYAYHVKRRHYDNESMFFHPPMEGLCAAEAILYHLRPDSKFTKEEALLLDTCLMLHAEHGGGNNSAFAARVLSSSGTDTYATISAAMGALKGPRHGGANNKVCDMRKEIEENVRDWNDDDEVRAYLTKIVKREAGDGSGLIYGMGHAVYTLSDPRAVLLKKAACKLAEEKGFGDSFRLLERIERLSPAVLRDVRGIDKTVCANVDMYAGLVYSSLGISPELFTPVFAVARMAGWCAHRMEELITCHRIIRPAYKSVVRAVPYVPLADRQTEGSDSLA